MAVRNRLYPDAGQEPALVRRCDHAVYFALANSALHDPEGAALLAVDIYSTLTHLRRQYGELRQLAALRARRSLAGLRPNPTRSGLGRLFQLDPSVRSRLVTCPTELLPLYATLAAVSAQFDGPVDARSVFLPRDSRVPFPPRLRERGSGRRREGDFRRGRGRVHRGASPPAAAPSRWFLRTRCHLVRVVRPAGRSDDHGDAARPGGRRALGEKHPGSLSHGRPRPTASRSLVPHPKARQESLSICASCHSGRGSSRPCPAASSTPASRTASLRSRTRSWKSCGEPPNSGPTCRVFAPCTRFWPTSSPALLYFRSFQTNRRRRFSACAGHVSSGARGHRYRVPVILRHLDTTPAELPARGPSPAIREDPAAAPSRQ